MKNSERKIKVARMVFIFCSEHSLFILLVNIRKHKRGQLISKAITLII